MAIQRERIYDQLLAVRCRRGDRQAWQEVVRRWEMPLFYYLRRLLHHEADAWDTLQQTWIAAYRGIGSLSNTANFIVWLHRIARNLAISHRRGARHALAELAIEETELPECSQQSPDSRAEAFDDAEQVHRAMDQLSVAHREVLALYFMQDLSIEQIAMVTGASEGTIKSRLYYAKRALREKIDRQRDTEGRP